MNNFLQSILTKIKNYKKENNNNQPPTKLISRIEYKVVEIPYDIVRNVLGNVVDKKTKYAIEKRENMRLGGTYYLIFHEEKNGKCIVSWEDYSNRNATWFCTKQDAVLKLQDLLDNPNKYILK